MTIMPSYVRIRDNVIKLFLNFTRFLPIAYSHQVLASSEKKFDKFAFFIMF